MGANEKYEATYHGGEYGEILDSSRLHYALSKDPGNGRTTEEWWAVKDETFKDFDRAIAKIKAEAWDEGREAGSENQIHWNGNWYTGGHEEITNPYKEAPNA